jgi:hypothetical protein
MYKSAISSFLMFSFLFFCGCGESPSDNSAEKTTDKSAVSSKNEEESAEETIVGTWRHEEDGGKSFEEWIFSQEEFTHQGGGAMEFKEKGGYSIENLKEGNATLALTDIQGNMGTDDRTIIITLGADKTQVSVNNLNFKRVTKK